MRDYAKLSKSVHCCVDCQCEICPRGDTPFGYIECKRKLADDTADAIEELLAAVSSVVKCKECRWCHSGYCEKYDDLIPFGCANKPWEDWFCADGKRREIIKEAQDAD